MKTKINLVKLCCCFVVVFSACKKNPAPLQQQDQPMKRAHGTVNGTTVTKVIGTEGGRISSADGSLSVEVPAGAVNGDVSFSIQPITKTLETATGPAYRLAPANVNFQKDVKITFKYEQQDLDGSAEDYLYLAYQNDQGYFYRVNNTGIDKENRLLFANTRHFSDWYIERTFCVAATKTALSAGEETDLLLFLTQSYQDGQLTETRPKIVNEKWFINGPGTVNKVNQTETGLIKAAYKAPASIVEPKTIAVGAEIRNMVDKINPDRAGTGGLVIVQTTIQLLAEEFITWEFNGVTHTGITMDAAKLGNTVTLLGTANTGNVMISLNADKPGSYEQGPPAEAEKFSIMVGIANQPQVIYQGSYSECKTGTQKYGKGKVELKSLGNIGGFVSGSFSGTVYSGGGCEMTTKQITGGFKLRRKA